MKVLAILVAALAALVIPISATAGNLPAPNSGTLVLEPDSTLALGGYVAFTATWSGHLSNPQVQVACYQDVNQDGTIEVGNLLGPDLVYGRAINKSGYGTFKGNEFAIAQLGDFSYWSQHGGSAECRADLFYYKVAGTNREWNGSGQQEAVFLATLGFSAEG